MTLLTPFHSCAAQLSPPVVPLTERVLEGLTTRPVMISHAGLKPAADGPLATVQVAPWPFVIRLLSPKFSEQVIVTKSPALV